MSLAVKLPKAMKALFQHARFQALHRLATGRVNVDIVDISTVLERIREIAVSFNGMAM